MSTLSNKTYKSILILIYPLFISILLQYNTCQNLYETFNFIFENINILIFNYFFSSLLLLIIILLFKKAYISIAINGGILYILSCIEYFKYKTSGSHLFISDLIMTTNVSDVGKFASLKLTYPLVINLILLIIYIYLVYKANIVFNISFKNRAISSIILISALSLIFATSLSTKFFDVFEITTAVDSNILESNDKFNDIGFLPFLAQTTAENLNNEVKKPINYSKETIDSLLVTDNKNDSKNSSTKTPNVIFIMSESFSDFRKFQSLNIDTDIYKGFDEVANEGLLGNCTVPTFGGYTTRTEFELLIGLPTFSLNTPSIPQNLLKSQDIINSVPSYFKNLGYATTYIHPFSGSFYNRDTLYPNYSFDNLYFEDNLTIEPTLFRRYISDKSVFDQIKEQLASNENPSYIFTTTMQNHQPYYADSAEDADQLSYYLAGVKETSNQLRDFTNWLKDFDEDVILVFVGDHMPFFTPDDDVYNRLDVDEANAELLYNQKFIIWNNYDSSIFTNATKENISTFYIPYLLIDLLGLPSNTWINTMTDSMNSCPVYSPNYQSCTGKNEKLDLLTYDRVLGEGFSN